MVEFWKDLFGNNINTYTWLFVLTSWLMISNFELNKKNLKIKASIIYILFYLFAILNIFDIKILIIILSVSLFVVIEFIFVDDIQRKILKKINYCVLDFFYKIICEYKILYFIISMFFISNFLKKVSKKFFILLQIKKLINIDFSFLYFIFTMIISIILLLRGIVKSINSEFETLDFSNILNKMNILKPFSTFSCNTKLYDFANILIDREDRSFFSREKTYNWISLEFIKYRLKRMKKESSNLFFKDRYCNNINFILYILYKFYKFIINTIKHIMIIVNEVVIHRKNIKNYMRGYSTIEMQLIRTLAVKDGYSTHTFQRKTYEFIYSKIFFTSLKNYYIYHHYLNIKDYKYYLIYLYIRIAPVKINGVLYENILELYKKKKINDITIEEFYIWVLGLSHCPINEYIIREEKVRIFKMKKNKLKKLIKRFSD